MRWSANPGPLAYRIWTLYQAGDAADDAAVLCAWCGKPVGVEAVVIAKMVTYHLLCWERREWLVERTKLN